MNRKGTTIEEESRSRGPRPVGSIEFKTVGPVKTWRPSRKILAEWKTDYPDLNVDAEMRVARSWLQSNPKRRKTARGMTRFLNAWLARSNDNPRSRSTSSSTVAPKTDDARRSALRKVGRK